MYVILFLTSLAFIALRAFQQLNVQHDRYLWVPPTTMLMAITEVLTITTVAEHGTLRAAIPMALGGILGCWFSMWLHRRIRRAQYKEVK